MRNRGIENPSEYINLDDSCLISYKNLDNMQHAVSCFTCHIENRSHIHILADCDVDGYTSAAMVYQYVRELDNQANITYSIHTGKQHGITDDITIPDNTNLLIVPDAGTNDCEQCRALKEKGVDIIILDHHIKDVENPYAIVVNNQISDNYGNKELCGAGVVYKFLQALDDNLWQNLANTYLDLVAFAHIADCVDIKSYETKRLVDKGICNIKNEFLQALVDRQSYSIGEKLTIIGVQFYIVSLINALIRVGTQEEKDMLFKALIQENAYFDYKTKASKDKPSEIIHESIYNRAVRFCINAKGKQNRMVEKNMAALRQYIELNSLHEHKIMFVPAGNIVESVLSGIAAIKLASEYNKPCLLLREMDGDKKLFSGSGRNINNSPIPNLKKFLLESGFFNKVAGHNNAFGVEIELENISSAISKLDFVLSEMSFEPHYLVDFTLEAKDVTVGLVYNIASLSQYYGEGLKEARLFIKDICIEKSDMSIIGKNADTISFLNDDEVTFIKFKCLQSEPLMEILNESWSDTTELKLNIVGRANINTYGNKKTPQIIIDDYEIASV